MSVHPALDALVTVLVLALVGWLVRRSGRAWDRAQAVLRGEETPDARHPPEP